MYFGFYMWMQESKYIFVFLDLINAKNKSAHESVGKVFLMIKIGLGRVHGFTCLLSHKVVLALSTKWITETLT
jgi:hypothetical protein